jgi:hypothetical protein
MVSSLLRFDVMEIVVDVVEYDERIEQWIDLELMLIIQALYQFQS